MSDFDNIDQYNPKELQEIIACIEKKLTESKPTNSDQISE